MSHSHGIHTSTWHTHIYMLYTHANHSFTLHEHLSIRLWRGKRTVSHAHTLIHISKSRQADDCVMAHIAKWLIHQCTHECIMPRTYIDLCTHIRQSTHMHQWPHTWIRHGTIAHESWHNNEFVRSHMREAIRKYLKRQGIERKEKVFKETTRYSKKRIISCTQRKESFHAHYTWYTTLDILHSIYYTVSLQYSEYPALEDTAPTYLTPCCTLPGFSTVDCTPWTIMTIPQNSLSSPVDPPQISKILGLQAMGGDCGRW